MRQELRDRWENPGKLTVISFGKEMVIDKLASHSCQHFCLPHTNTAL